MIKERQVSQVRPNAFPGGPTPGAHPSPSPLDIDKKPGKLYLLCVKKKMFFLLTAAFLMLILTVGSNPPRISAQDGSKPQIKKPRYDYMSTFLRRDTKPLGLTENPTLKKYMSQPSIKWVIRSAKKHILL